MSRGRAATTLEALSRRGRRVLRPGAPPHAVVHCGHHKVGTVWWGNILRAVATQHGMRFQELDSRDVDPGADVYLFSRTRHFDRGALAGRPFRGTHLIRDPRDIAVSGYFYHLWTEEPWANKPNPRYGGRSYREQLHSLDRDAGLLLEIERTCTGGQLPEMASWDYGQEEFLELKYEELVADEVGVFTSVFRHFGFDDRGVQHALSVVDSFSFRQVTGREIGEVGTTSHLRSGQPGEWRQHLGPQHIARWNELAGDALVVLGYETGPDWAPEPAPPTHREG